MYEDVFLIDNEGKRISSDTISSHIGLALKVMEQRLELKEEFEKSNRRNPLEFLLGDKGYMTISEMGTYRKIVYDSELSSEKQKKWIEYYQKQGYELKDLAMEKSMERGE